MTEYQEETSASVDEKTTKQPFPRCRKRWFVGTAIFILLGACIAFLWLCSYPVSQGQGRLKAPVVVSIPSGTSVRGIQEILHQSGGLKKDIRFLLLTQYLGVANRLQAGEYRFVPDASPRAIIDDLVAGNTILHSLTVPEGSSLFQVAAILARDGWSNEATFLQLTRSRPFLRSFGLSVKNLEGYLFPDTYLFPRGERLERIVTRMVDRGTQVYKEECQKQKSEKPFDCSTQSKGAKDKAWGRHEALTLASIVEKETSLAEERGLVARVFFNRLARNMRLQADPTVRYGVRKLSEPLSKIDLQTPGAYNTYLNKGLPPGPICNPGRASLRAVFHPADGEVVYFVSKNNGSHTFSKTLREHNRAVRRLRRLQAEEKKEKK